MYHSTNTPFFRQGDIWRFYYTIQVKNNYKNDIWLTLFMSHFNPNLLTWNMGDSVSVSISFFILAVLFEIHLSTIAIFSPSCELQLLYKVALSMKLTDKTKFANLHCTCNCLDECSRIFQLAWTTCLIWVMPLRHVNSIKLVVRVCTIITSVWNSPTIAEFIESSYLYEQL